MSYKISNNEERLSIERELGIPYKYPSFYIPKRVINGLNESFVSIITMDEPELITHAIWGMLPENFDGEWNDFQQAYNTLYVDENDVWKSPFFKEALLERRCLIIASGYFTYYLNGNKIYPLYNHPEEYSTCCLAGVYNTIEDGFLTCSIIKGENNLIKSVDGKTPLIIPSKYHNSWLAEDTALDEIKHILKGNEITKMLSKNIPDDLLNYEIHFETMVDDAF